jgi:hypothetical protein
LFPQDALLKMHSRKQNKPNESILKKKPTQKYRINKMERGCKNTILINTKTEEMECGLDDNSRRDDGLE